MCGCFVVGLGHSSPHRPLAHLAVHRPCAAGVQRGVDPAAAGCDPAALHDADLRGPVLVAQRRERVRLVLRRSGVPHRSRGMVRGRSLRCVLPDCAAALTTSGPATSVPPPRRRCGSGSADRSVEPLARGAARGVRLATFSTALSERSESGLAGFQPTNREPDVLALLRSSHPGLPPAGDRRDPRVGPRPTGRPGCAGAPGIPAPPDRRLPAAPRSPASWTSSWSPPWRSIRRPAPGSGTAPGSTTG